MYEGGVGIYPNGKGPGTSETNQYSPENTDH
jgi:hypothetical protein